MNHVELMFVTNNPEIAEYAQRAGVDRIWVDLEYIGKSERQRNLDSLKSRHSLSDITSIKKIIDSSKLIVRVNPIHEGSEGEIKEVIELGADIIMLPMFKTAREVEFFLSCVNKEITTCLLLETPQALVRIDEILKINGIDEVHVGINDLHLGMGLDFMFELLSGGIIDYIAQKVKQKGIRFGFGGITKISSGILSSELVLSEHYRLGSEIAILSREFIGQAKSLKELRQNIDLENEIRKIRNVENELRNLDINELNKNHIKVQQIVNRIVNCK